MYKCRRKVYARGHREDCMDELIGTPVGNGCSGHAVNASQL